MPVNISKAVKSPCHDQRLKTALIHRIEIDPFDKIKDILKIASSASFIHDMLYGRFSQTFYSCQPETYVSFFVHREPGMTFVYVRYQYMEPHTLAFLHKEGYLLNIA